MATAVQNRKRLEYKVDRLVEGAEDAIGSHQKQIDKLHHDFTRMADIHAGIDHALLLQTRTRHLNWRIERLARGVRYWSSPWWRRAWMRLRGRAVERWVAA